jgi:hypothetical protein
MPLVLPVPAADVAAIEPNNNGLGRPRRRYADPKNTGKSEFVKRFNGLAKIPLAFRPPPCIMSSGSNSRRRLTPDPPLI